MSANTKPKIVVGVSGSNASTAALSWAADEADRQHGQLTVIICWSADHLAYYAHPSQEDPGLRQERARRDLAATIHAVLGPAQNNATTEIVTGTAERALVDQSAEADLLVLGSAAGITAGRSIGPVVRTCLSHAHCPVVVVSPEHLPCRDLEDPSDQSSESYDRFLPAVGAVPLPRSGDQAKGEIRS